MAHTYGYSTREVEAVEAEVRVTIDYIANWSSGSIWALRSCLKTNKPMKSKKQNKQKSLLTNFSSLELIEKTDVKRVQLANVIPLAANRIAHRSGWVTA